MKVRPFGGDCFVPATILRGSKAGECPDLGKPVRDREKLLEEGRSARHSPRTKARRAEFRLTPPLPEYLVFGLGNAAKTGLSPIAVEPKLPGCYPQSRFIMEGRDDQCGSK